MRLVAEFTIKGLPELPNKKRYKHWAIQRKEVHRWKRFVHEQCCLARINGLGLDTAVLTFTRHSSVQPDFDNLVSSFKACQDGLVFACVIQDDKEINVGQPSYKWEYRARKEGGIITIKIETKENLNGQSETKTSP